MPRFSKWRTKNSESDIEMSEKDGVRALHLGSSMVQSAMRLTAPNELELAYTRCMMGFLLFHPNPIHIVMIGLGGGSLAKFVYERMLKTKPQWSRSIRRSSLPPAAISPYLTIMNVCR